MKSKTMLQNTLHILRKALGISEPKKRIQYRNVSHLAGKWSQKELQDFMDQLSTMRAVD